MKEKGNKGRVLFLRAYLEEHTDDDHSLTTEELITICKKHGFSLNRQTLADDVAALNASGFEVIVSQVPRNGTTMNAYHVGARLFELPELKLLLDAVSSSRFITAEKSDVLIRKIGRLTNGRNRKELSARIYTEDRLKTTNPNVLVNIDVVYQAINHHHKICFHYWDYRPSKRKFLKNDGELYVASPYALIWNDDRYYAPSFSDKHQKIVNYRIDRMCDVEEMEEDWIPDPGFNAAEHSQKMIKMFDGDLMEENVALLCENELMKNVIDRFGEKVRTKIVDKEHFLASVKVVPSSTFFGWILQYQGGIVITGPEWVKDSFSKTLSRMLSLHTGENGEHEP